jgi:hypothetical protein
MPEGGFVSLPGSVAPVVDVRSCDPQTAAVGKHSSDETSPTPADVRRHTRWMSRDDALALYEGHWGNHLCGDCPCFRCVTLRWARKPKCVCAKKASRSMTALGIDHAVRLKRLHCKCRPPTQVWEMFWCLCDSSPQWSRTGNPSFLIGDAVKTLPEATLDVSSESDVDADSPRWRQRRRLTL